MTAAEICARTAQKRRVCDFIDGSMFILPISLKRRRTYLYINRCCFCAYCTNYMYDIMCKCYNNINIC